MKSQSRALPISISSFSEKLSRFNLLLRLPCDVPSFSARPEILVFVWIDFDEDISEENVQEENKEEVYFDILTKQLNETQQEYLKWIRHQGVSSRNATVDLEWAKRWVIMRAYELIVRTLIW